MYEDYEVDQVLTSQDEPVRLVRSYENDHEVVRDLAVRPRTSTTPNDVFSTLHDALVDASFSKFCDLPRDEIEQGLDTVRVALRDWTARALSGNAEVTLSAVDCWSLSQLVDRVAHVVALAALEQRHAGVPRLAPINDADEIAGLPQGR